MIAEPTGDNTTFIITDNSSHFAKILPEKYIEPLVIIAKVKGYKGIDDFILELVKDRLEMFTDTRDHLDDSFQQYMHDLMIGKHVPNEWARNDASGENVEPGNEEEEKENEDLE